MRKLKETREEDKGTVEDGGERYEYLDGIKTKTKKKCIFQCHG